MIDRPGGWGGRHGAACLLTLLACAVATGCRPRIDVDVIERPGYRDGPWRTYRWWRPPLDGNPAEPAVQVDWAIRSAVDRELAARGYRGVAMGPSDVVIDYDVELRNRPETFRDFVRYKAGGGRKDFGEVFMDGLEEGTLVLRVRQVDAGPVVWQGSATGLTDPVRSGRNIPRAAALLVGRLPDAG